MSWLGSSFRRSSANLFRSSGETPAAGRPRIPVHRGLERDRAYYVVALTDLHPAAVLPPIPESAEPAELRFEVER